MLGKTTPAAGAPYMIAAILMVLAVGALLAYVWSSRRLYATSPFAWMAAAVAIFYVVDWAHIRLTTNQYGTTFALSGKSFTVSEGDVEAVGGLVALSLFTMIIGHWLVRKRRTARPPTSSPRIPYGRLLVLTSALVLLAYTLLTVFAQAFGGLAVYWQNVSARAFIFEEHSLLYAFLDFTVIGGGFAVGLLAGNTSRFLDAGANKTHRRLMEFLLLAFVLGLAFLTGGRFSLLRAAFTMLVGHAVVTARWRIRRSTALLAVLFLAISSSVVLANRTIESRENPLEEALDTTEISQSNNLLILGEEQLDGSADGSTISAGLTAFVPNSVLQPLGLEKGDGGNAFFTSRVFPERWAVSRSEVALGFLGEATMSFGFWFAPAWAFLAGILAGMMERIQQGTIMSAGLRAVACLSAFQLVRGSLYNTVVGTAVSIAAMVAVALVVTTGLARLVPSAPIPRTP